MYKKILVALDGSQLSEGILPYARAFAKALKIPVELLHVIEPETLMPTTVEHRRYYNVLVAERERSENYLKKVGTSFSGASTVDCAVDVGNPAAVIVDRAAADLGALIAIATHGRSGIKRWVLGSVADKVLHAATNHLLLVRASEERKGAEARSLKRVVVPLDGSLLAEMVIPHAVELARKMDLEVILVRVYLVPGAAYPTGEYAPDWELLEREISETANSYLQAKMLELRKERLERVSSAALEGSAAERIIDLARERPESLVTMCTHGRSGVGRWVLGSVTDRVVRHSGDPVLVIRAPSARSAS